MNSTFLVPPLLISLILLLIRVIVGVSFFFSALNKAKNPQRLAKQNGIPLPILLFVMCAEFAGALGLVSGILGQFAALGLLLLMTVTLILHIFVWRTKYWANKGGWEYDAMLFCLCATIVVFGVGSFAI